METQNLNWKQALMGFGAAVVLAYGLTYITVIRPENIRQKEQIKLEQKLNNNNDYTQLKQEFKANQHRQYNSNKTLHQLADSLDKDYLKKIYVLALENGLDTSKYVIKLEDKDIRLEYKQSQ
jgi:hypothetical protein